MSNWQFIPSVLALVWAGVSLGGSLIATPAKFAAPSLTMPTALEVGRAQFQWVGIGEMLLAAGLISTLLIIGKMDWRLAAVPVGLFAIQRLAVMPSLDARTLQVIAGEPVGPSSLHIAYIVLEVAKFLSLLGAGVWGLSSLMRQG